MCTYLYVYIYVHLSRNIQANLFKSELLNCVDEIVLIDPCIHEMQLKRFIRLSMAIDVGGLNAITFHQAFRQLFLPTNTKLIILSILVCKINDCARFYFSWLCFWLINFSINYAIFYRIVLYIRQCLFIYIW